MQRVDPKRIFAAALEELLLTASFQEITVEAIIKKAELSKNTFYRNFSDKYDLANWYYDHFILNELSQPAEGQSWEEATLDTMNFIYSKRIYFGKLAAYTGQNSFFECFRNITYSTTSAYLKKKLSCDTLPDDLVFLLRYAIAGMAVMTTEWIRDRFPIAPNEFAKKLNAANPLTKYADL